MTQNELIYILTIAEHQSLSAASRELFLSQPSLSQTLAKVEAEVGYPIFLRTPAGLTITDSGKEFVRISKLILERYKSLLTELEEFHALYRGTITLGIPANLGACLLPAVIPEFQAMYPDIKIVIQEDNSVVLNNLLLNGKTDLNIMHYEDGQDLIHYESLMSDPFYLVIPDSMKQHYRFPEDRELSANDLKQLDHQPFIMIAKKQKLRQIADSIIKNANITPDIRYETKSMETAKRLAANGMGVIFLPYSYLNLYSGTEHLACYPLDDTLGASWQLVIAYTETNPLSRCSREFIETLKHMILPAAT
ncbi:MAG: LysR family transcriptional regulator [Lachnospiraceae bacterium]